MEEKQDFELTEFSFLKRPSCSTIIKVAAGNVSERFEFEEAQIDTLSFLNENFLDAAISNQLVYNVQVEALLINKIWNAANSVVHKLLKKVCMRPAAYEKLNLEYINLDVFEWPEKLRLIQQISDRYELYENGTICFVHHNGAYVDLNSITGKLNVLLDAGIDVQLLLQVTVGKDDMLTSHERSSSNSGRDRRSRDRDYRYDDDDDSSTSSDESSKKKKKKKKKRKSRKEKRKRKKKRKSRKRSKKHRRERDDSSTSSDDSSTSSDDSSTFSDDSSTSSDESGTRVKEKRRSQSESSGRERKKKRKEEVDRSLPLSEVNVVNNETSLSRITESSRRSGSPSDDVGQLSSEQQNQLTKENDSLNAQVTALKDEVSRLKQEKQEQSNLAKEQENALNAEVTALKDEVSRLKQEKQVLSGHSNDLKKRENELQNRDFSLREYDLNLKGQDLKLKKFENDLKERDKFLKEQEKSFNQRVVAWNKSKPVPVQSSIVRPASVQSSIVRPVSVQTSPPIILTREQKRKLSPELRVMVALTNAVVSQFSNIEVLFADIEIDDTKSTTINRNMILKQAGTDLLKEKPFDYYLNGSIHSLEKRGQTVQENYAFKVGLGLLILRYIITVKERVAKDWKDAAKWIHEKYVYILREAMDIKFLEYLGAQHVKNTVTTTILNKKGKPEIKKVEHFRQRSHRDSGCIDQFANFINDNLVVKQKKTDYHFAYDSNWYSDCYGQAIELRDVKVSTALGLVVKRVQHKVDIALGKSTDENDSGDEGGDEGGTNGNGNSESSSESHNGQDGDDGNNESGNGSSEDDGENEIRDSDDGSNESDREIESRDSIEREFTDNDEIIVIDDGSSESDREIESRDSVEREFTDNNEIIVIDDGSSESDDGSSESDGEIESRDSVEREFTGNDDISQTSTPSTPIRYAVNDKKFALKTTGGRLVGRLGYIGESSTTNQDFFKSDEWIKEEQMLKECINKLDRIEFVARAFSNVIIVKMSPKIRKKLEALIGKSIFRKKDLFFASYGKHDKTSRKWSKFLQDELNEETICTDSSEFAIPGSECYSLAGSKRNKRAKGNLIFYEIGKEGRTDSIPIDICQISAFFNSNEEALTGFIVSNRYQDQKAGSPLHASHRCHNPSCIRPLHLLYEFYHYNVLRGSGTCCGWVYYIVDGKRVWEPSNSCNHYPRCENVKEVPSKPFKEEKGMICVPIAKAA